ncbi:MAG: MATE family efflux transporter [Oscillospiraceae bacterium]|nr:MATE family efflux transporter [Oscillospiraceae bacterium]
MNIRRHIETDRDFYRAILAIAIPVMLQSAIMRGMGLVNSIMLGNLGETYMAAYHLGNQLYNLFGSISFGLVAGCCVMVSQYWGSRDLAAIRRIMAYTLKLLCAVTVLFMAVGLFIPEQFMRLYSGEADVIAAGVPYVRVVCFCFAFYGFSNLYLLSIRSIENARLYLIVDGISYAINIFINYLLIYGRFGLPKLGIIGVAIGTIIAKVIEAAVCVVHMLKYEKTIRFRPGDLRERADRELRRTFFRFAIPVAMHEIIWGIGNSMYSSILGHVGADAISAHSVVESFSSICIMFTSGLVSAAGVLIGKSIGAGEGDRVFRKAQSIMLIALGSGIFSGLLHIITRPMLISFYPNLGTETTGLIRNFMTICALLCPFQALELTSSLGTLRGGGDAAFVVAEDTFVMWCICIPLASLATYRWGLSPSWVYFLLKMDLVFKSTICVIRILRRKWVKKITE